MNLNYTLCSGYYERASDAQDFSRLWLANIKKYAHPKPSKIVVLSVGGCSLPFVDESVDEVLLAGNLGHLHQLVGKELPRKNHHFCGWSAAVMAGAMIAYANETDCIWWEQDCLAFGDVIGQMYRDLGPAADIVFGGPMKSPPYMSAAQGLFLVRHKSIPAFVSSYLTMGPDDIAGNLPEDKFTRLQLVKNHLSFGVDRCRPIPNTMPYYVQQLTAPELAMLKERGLL